jgi:hypothetical protein
LASLQVVLAEPAVTVFQCQQLLLAVNFAAALGMGVALKHGATSWLLAVRIIAAVPPPMSLTPVGRTLSGLVTTSVSASTPTPMFLTLVGSTLSALDTTFLSASTPTPMRDTLVGSSHSALVTTSYVSASLTRLTIIGTSRICAATISRTVRAMSYKQRTELL